MSSMYCKFENCTVKVIMDFTLFVTGLNPNFVVYTATM
jgi:hypothetical protein